MSYFSSGFLLAAKVLAAKDWTHPKCILLARHLAHGGSTIQEISDTLGWNVSLDNARRRLQKFNIRPHGKHNRAHRGDLTSLSNHGSGFRIKSYRPAERAA